jgi:aspartate racemase
VEPVSSLLLGVIGGPGSSAAEFHAPLLQAALAASGGATPEIVTVTLAAGEAGANGLRHRKMRLFEAVGAFEHRGAAAVFLPGWTEQTLLAELRAETTLPIADFLGALAGELSSRAATAKGLTVGVLADVTEQAAIAHALADSGVTVRFPKTPLGATPSAEACVQAARELTAAGATVIIPAPADVAAVAALRAAGVDVFDSPTWYATRGLATARPQPKPFKIGIVGGVGPAATVDFLDKIVKATPAKKDQEHIKVVVEQNPQIPDRTRNLILGEIDPTIPLYATCRRLEAAGADIITIPCNTAHAYVEDLQQHLSIPIVSMLKTTIDHIAATYGTSRRVGLLATTGTVRTGVYHAVAKGIFDLMVPDDAHQEKVMASIYGPLGVKAGYTEGQCMDDLLAGVKHLVDRGAEILILGCTELPVLIDESDDYRIAGKSVVMLDPTNLLARRCVELAQQASAAGR